MAVELLERPAVAAPEHLFLPVYSPSPSGKLVLCYGFDESGRISKKDPNEDFHIVGVRGYFERFRAETEFEKRNIRKALRYELQNNPQYLSDINFRHTSFTRQHVLEVREFLRKIKTKENGGHRAHIIARVITQCRLLDSLGYNGDGNVGIDMFDDESQIRENVLKFMPKLFRVKITEDCLSVEQDADDKYYAVGYADAIANIIMSGQHGNYPDRFVDIDIDTLLKDLARVLDLRVHPYEHLPNPLSAAL